MTRHGAKQRCLRGKPWSGTLRVRKWTDGLKGLVSVARQIILTKVAVSAAAHPSGGMHYA